MIHRTVNLRASEEGAVAVEAALALPVFLLLLLGVIQFGLALWQNHTMLLAVSQAGRYAMINSPCASACQTQATTMINSAAPFATGSVSTAAPGCTGMRLTATSTVSVSYIVPLTLPPVSICVPLL
jgi:Flp pilus assembly protein TadG